MSDMTLAIFVKAAAGKFAIPGVAVAVWADGTQTYACYGVTSLTEAGLLTRHLAYWLDVLQALLPHRQPRIELTVFDNRVLAERLAALAEQPADTAGRDQQVASTDLDEPRQP
jgi:hypothetical protein